MATVKTAVLPSREAENSMSGRAVALAGLPVADATSQLEAAGFTVADGGEVNSEVTAGNVAYTSPAGGTSLGSGDTVTLYTSTGYVPPPPSTGNGGDNGGGKGNKGKGKGKGRR